MGTLTAKPVKATDAIRLLKADHAMVKGLLERLESARGASSRRSLFERVRKELVAHATVEEETFYPAYCEAVRSKEDRKHFFEAAEEHHLVTIVLDELGATDPADEAFSAKAKVLKDLVEHHAGEEEQEMFPAARKVLDRVQLEELGAKMVERKQELLGATKNLSRERR